MSWKKQTLRALFSLVLSRANRQQLGAFLLNEALGDNDGEAVTNGEYALLHTALKPMVGLPFIALDIGANLGEWTRELFKFANSEWRVFCFEPTPATCKKLSELLADTPCATPVNVALGDAAGTGSLRIVGELAGTNSLHHRPVCEAQLEHVETMDVPIMTGDAFCASRGLDRIDIIKIDTEGHEIAVLKGFDRMLTEHRIGLLQFEYGGSWLDARTQLADAFALLQPKGYLIAKVFPNGLKFIDAYHPKLDTFAYANYVALLPELKSRFVEIK